MKKHLQQFILSCLICLLFLHAHAQNKLTEAQIMNGNIFVKAIVNKTNCVINEPLLVTYKFYTRLQGQAKVSQLPTFTGCSVQEMGSESSLPEFETINGKVFKTNIIRKVQVYPLQIGDIVLGEASVEAALSDYNMNKTVSSSPVTIHVADFPSLNKPPSFDGAVGGFVIKAMVNKRNDTANDNNNLQIIIEGEGSFQNISCPVIAWPKDVEAFEPTVTEMVNKVTYPASGGKIFDIPFVTKQKGRITIPAIVFSYYDMQEHVYKTVSTEPIDINVAEAKTSNIDETKTYADITNKKYIWIVPAIALVAGICLFLYFKFDKKKSPAQLVADAGKMIEEELQQIEEKEAAREETDAEKLNKLLLCENDNQFFSEAKNLCQLMLGKENDVANQALLQQLVNDCNAALYAAGAISKDDVLRKLEAIIC